MRLNKPIVNVNFAKNRSTRATSLISPNTLGDNNANYRRNLEEQLAVGLYGRIWCQVLIGTTSGFMFVFVAALVYALYCLCYPYVGSVGFAILLSLVLHHKSREGIFGATSAKKMCIEQMSATQQAWAADSVFYGLIGSLLSLRFFFSFALSWGAMFLGLNKVLLKAPCMFKNTFATNVCEARRKQSEGNGRQYVQSSTEPLVKKLLAIFFFTGIAHLTVGVFFFLWLHIFLFALFVMSILFLSVETFFSSMWRIWRFAVVFFFVVALSYNLALDILFISDAVKRTTSVVMTVQQQWANKVSCNAIENINCTDISLEPNMSGNSFSSSVIPNILVEKFQQMVLKELAQTLNQTNATELANVIHTAVGPMFAQTPSKITINYLINKSKEAYGLFFHQKESLSKVNWIGLGEILMNRWVPFATFLTHVLLVLGSNMIELFDTIYAFILFACTLRYLLQLEHTVPYYVLAKMLRVFHPREGEYHAKIIEHDIVVSLSTLLQSFFYLTWFHFTITFCIFKIWSLPLSFICGVLSALAAFLPIVPKWFSPVVFAFLYILYYAVSTHGFIGAIFDLRLLSFFFALMALFTDEWVLSFPQGQPIGGCPGADSEQLPAFVTCTAVVLGYVTYGFNGIFLGPITVIFAKVLFDNWDVVLGSGVALSGFCGNQKQVK